MARWRLDRLLQNDGEWWEDGIVKRICVIGGTRPEAIKLAPLINLLRADARFSATVATTGQHADMLDQAFDFFGIRADLTYSVMGSRSDLLGLTERTMKAMAQLLEAAAPDMVIVQGDTTTAMAASLASFYSHVPVGHVEAGLRSFSLALPFPEEANRRIISVVSDLNFAPTQQAKENLLAEGIEESTIVVSGNTVIDALLSGVQRKSEPNNTLLKPVFAWPGPIVLVTAHRRESWGVGMDNIGFALRRLAARRPDLLIVLPLHRNPIVRDALTAHLADRPNIILTDPLDYGDLCAVLNTSTLVLTDSGGLQEEAPALGKPVLVLRTTTERPEGVEFGTAKLVGTDPEMILGAVDALLDDPEEYQRMSTMASPYGDGRASMRIVQALAWHFGMDERPNDFVPRAARPTNHIA